MLQLNYKLTDEDYIEFNEFHQLIHSEVGKRNLFKLRLIGPMISILAIVIFILARAEINVDRYRSNCIMHFFNCMCNTG